MSDQSETVLGKIPVKASLSIGSERISLFPTSARIIVAHIGKRGTGALATASLFGHLSGALEDLFKGGKESMNRKRLETLTPSEILASDKDNFAIDHEEVVSVVVEETPGQVRITILTKDEKYSFSTVWSFEKVVGLLQGTLGRKLVASRLDSREDIKR